MSPLARRLYALGWLALAAVALGYFAFLFKQANLPVPAISISLPSIFSKFATDHDTDGTGADPAVAQALTRMNEEIDRLKSDLQKSQQENAALKAHLRTFEQTYGPTTAALPPEAPEPRDAPERKADSSGNGEDTGNVQVMTMPLPTTGYIDELPESPLPIANIASPRRTLFAVELAKGLKADDVEARWKDIAKRHGKLFSQLEPRRLKSESGSAYSLIAGPFNNAAEAALMCARLSIVRLDCASTVFTGEPLGKVANR